jgi:hypothetical protein
MKLSRKNPEVCEYLPYLLEERKLWATFTREGDVWEHGKKKKRREKGGGTLKCNFKTVGGGRFYIKKADKFKRGISTHEKRNKYLRQVERIKYRQIF